ncbi:MAG TPA: hypothetical protein DEO59_16865 [Balneola sp.]|nr:hypothetical protein [Balneola sp.]
MLKTLKVQSQTITIGHSEYLDFGSKQLEQHHDMMLEQLEGQRARAKILDQKEIDRLYMKDYLDREQYASGERFFEMTIKAGCYIKGINIEQAVVNGTSSRETRLNIGELMGLRSLILTRVCKVLDDCIGNDARFVFDVIVNDRRVKRQEELDVLHLGLDGLNEYWNPRLRNDPRRHAVSALASLA